ncbi:LysR family transcriptional regulator [Kingella kingae]|uniref:LysR family transcriptional regulator n=1 Tax=Kingella kingae TaxID=504 RepID=UPI0002585587|nr:LysR family transcriptional regulator [Kingella kingae]EIC12904.1 transcriptional activator protein METR [Kingella kingae PYKK081]MDK4527574.1 LysR family transcriptional regulator [Kingella kingae]MDK4543204.1 LysR family transcriptional regulator [Kingella kingae]MDK4561615.1 LysR family transcriptional regulator [Kingella kingae]MDK4569013.1 LysR family transcriptional regulator [Kingella kingae]
MDSIIELRHLRTLLALEETGSVSLAAQRVHLTQSALSHQIRVLENYFDTPLFERKSTPLRFTPAGERLLKLGRELLPRVAAAERDLMQIIHGDAGELRVAVECHTCFDWLMPAMGVFRPQWPQVELDIVSGFQADPVALLLTHRADLAIVSEAVPQAGIVYQPLFAYEMVGICAPDHALAQKEIWQAEDFINETLITYPVPDDMLDLLRKVLLPRGINPMRRHSELTIAIVQLVASKRGIAALPYWSVMPYVEKQYVVARTLTDTPLQSELYAAIRNEDADCAYLTDFCDIVREEGFANLPGLSVLAMK